MNRVSKLVMIGLSALLVQFAYADGNSCGTPSCPPKECPKPQPKPCPKPCEPKPCAPKPCPKPCPPKPCAPCPPVCFERGYPNDNCCFPAAYNEPASFDLAPCAWDFWVDASFTYWEAFEEGLDFANSTSSLTANFYPTDSQTLFAPTNFKPGFKIGLGVDIGHDDWSAYAEYTWFRSTNSNHSEAPALPSGEPGVAVWYPGNWFENASGSTITAENISSKWTVNMDLVDVGLMRPFYQGTHLTMSPHGSMRGQFIRQKVTLNADSLFAYGGETALASSSSSSKSNSWAVGPRMGCFAKWLLGWGFRFEGDASASLLYTQYTKVSTKHTSAVVEDLAIPDRGGSYDDFNCLRAVNDMNVGLGWGSYFDCRNYHFDLLLSYDFQVFWNQNMIRRLVDQLGSRTGASPSNLYLQGLTVKAEFDF